MRWAKPSWPKAASHRDAAKERRERLQRGEDVPGGLFTGEDAKRILREQGWSESDIRHCVQVHEVSEAFRARDVDEGG